MTHGYGIIFYLLSTNLNSWRRGSISSKNSNIYKVSYLQYETCIADTIRYGSFSNFRNELNESVTPHSAHSDEPKWIYRRVCNNQHLTRWGRGGARPRNTKKPEPRLIVSDMFADGKPFSRENLHTRNRTTNRERIALRRACSAPGAIHRFQRDWPAGESKSTERFHTCRSHDFFI